MSSKIKYVFLLIFFFFFSIGNVLAKDFEIHSENAILYNLDEGTILYEKNPDEIISIASLTKIMTALIVIEHAANLEEKVILSYSDFAGLAEANASVAGFYIGEEVTLRDLLYGLLFPSGAEAAQALTRYFGGKEHFVSLMNEKAIELGLQHTYFKNETGLDEEGHYSTVREVGNIFQYAIQNEVFKSILETKEYQTSNKRKTFQSTIFKFLNKSGLSMDYLLGGKTGTTENAGLCLASVARSNGTNYMLITARAANDWIHPTHLYDAKTIYDYFIEHYENKILLSKDSLILNLETKFGKEENVSFYLEEEIRKYVVKDFTSEDLTIEYDGINEITPWQKKGDFLGTLTISYFGEEIASQRIILSKSISFDFLKFFLTYQKEFLGAVGFLCFFFFLYYKIRKRRLKYESRKNSTTNKKNKKRK